MRISIITSTLNDSSSLDRTLSTISSWGCGDLEYIIIDGGSKDGIESVVSKYFKLISYFSSEGDNGIYDAWNKGLLQATGDYIAFVGSGDYYLPGGLNKMMECAKSHPDAELIFSKICIVNANNDFITEGEAWNWRKFRRYMHVDHPGALHSRKFFDNFGIFDSQFKIAGDYEIILRAGSSLRSEYLDDVVFSMSSGGISHNSSRVFWEVFRAKLKNNSVTIFIALLDYFSSSLSFYIRKAFRF